MEGTPMHSALPINQAEQDLLHFAFQDHDIRTVPDRSTLWVWMAAIDVFEAAGKTWAGRRSIKKLPEDWVRVVRCATPQGYQETYFIAEPAIYVIFATSKHPSGQRLFRWVFEEVLPSIRANGYYGHYSAGEQMKATDQMMKLVEKMDGGSNAVVDALYPAYQECCRKLRIKPQPITAFKDKQLEMEGL
jgi:prophage antirepressor-like protein